MRASPVPLAGRRRPAARRTLLPLALCVAAAGVPAPSAFAHAAFVESQPAPGARLETAPRRVTLQFSEPLNRALSKATLVNLASGKPVAARFEAGAERELTARPLGQLDPAAYRVEWHTVSTEDGHALEGSFSFGVRVAAAAGEQRIEQSPLARDGWLRVAFRVLFYASLLFFAGGAINAALLGGRGDPAGWLVPRELRPAPGRAGPDLDRLSDRVRLRTLDAGWLAASAAAAVAVVEAADAGGGLRPDGLADFLLSNVAGLARIGTVAAIVAAALLAPRRPLAAAGSLAVAFAGVSIGGHANSADPRLAAVASDWVHLLAGGVWLGGIAQIAWCWLPALRAAPRELRRGVMREVLDRFGRVALPAFLVLAATGLVSALIQLGAVDALWRTAYGRVLAVKVSLVALIALASWWHALRLRPRLLAANPHPGERLERRHWRLLRSEPLLSVGVVVAAALLVAFPLPPRQLGEAEETAEARPGGPPCDPCPLPRPAAGELAVAEQAGSSVAAVWLRREGPALAGRLRLLGRDLRPVRAAARIPLAVQRSCGPGCWDFRFRRAPASIDVRVPERGTTYVARLPARWRAGAGARARSLLVRAQRVMGRLRSVRERETVTSGPGSFAETGYRLGAPDRLAYVTDSDAATVVIGGRQWLRTAGLPWERQRYAGGGPPFRTRSWFRWTSYAQAVRLLAVRDGPPRVAELALLDPGTPVWYRLGIDLATMRVLRVRMIAESHFMGQRFFAFNRPVRIEPPAPAGAR